MAGRETRAYFKVEDYFAMLAHIILAVLKAGAHILHICEEACF